VEISDNLEELLGKKRASLDDLQSDFSSKTLQNIFEENKKDTEVKSGDYISNIVSSILESGIKSELLGSDIKKAVNKHREDILMDSFFKLSRKIIDDVLFMVEEKQKFNDFKLEDMLIAGKITDSLKEKELDTLEKILIELFSGENKIVIEEHYQSELLYELFKENEESNYGGLVLMELFYKLFYKEEDFKKPAIHSPIFESLISYT